MRIASLLSSNTEMACAIGLADSLVGISHECDHPAEILHLPRLTRICVDSSAPSAEIDREVRERLHAGLPLYEIDEATLQALKPDLVMTQAQCAVCAINEDDVRAALARFPDGSRPQAVSFAPETLEGVFEDMSTLGRAAGVEDAARRAVEGLRARVDKVRGVMGPMKWRPATLVMEWLDPPMPGGCWTPALVEMAGGRPVLGGGTAKTYGRQWDEVAACGAEAIVISPCGFKVEQSMKELDALFARPEIQALPAIERKSRVIVADGNALFNRPGPRLVDTLELLAHALHPESSRHGGISCPRGMGFRWRGGDTWEPLETEGATARKV